MHMLICYSLPSEHPLLVGLSAILQFAKFMSAHCVCSFAKVLICTSDSARFRSAQRIGLFAALASFAHSKLKRAEIRSATCICSLAALLPPAHHGAQVKCYCGRSNNQIQVSYMCMHTAVLLPKCWHIPPTLPSSGQLSVHAHLLSEHPLVGGQSAGKQR